MNRDDVSEEIIYVDEQGNRVNPQGGTPSTSQYSYPPITQNRQDKADILDKIRPDLIVDVIRHKLMGEEFVNGRWVTNERLRSRALTPTGAQDITNLMLSVSSQNVSLSKLDDDTIRKRALAIAVTAQRMCLDFWREYGIKSSSQLEFVHQIVFSNTLVTLKQPEGEGIRKLIQGTTTEQRSIIEQGDIRRKGLFGLGGRR